MNYYLSVLQDYALFNGRAGRSEFWYFFLFNSIIAFLFGIIGIAAEIPILYLIYTLAALPPAIGVSIRRMHDVGKSGWFLLIPLYNLILALKDSDPGDNLYGPNPED